MIEAMDLTFKAKVTLLRSGGKIIKGDPQVDINPVNITSVDRFKEDLKNFIKNYDYGK